MEKEKTQVWYAAHCLDCKLFDSLYKGYCKPCFDKRKMEYDPKDLEELNSK